MDEASAVDFSSAPHQHSGLFGACRQHSLFTRAIRVISQDYALTFEPLLQSTHKAVPPFPGPSQITKAISSGNFVGRTYQTWSPLSSSGV